MTILQLVYKLNAISIERNKIEMGLIREPDSKVLKAALDVLNEEHDAVIYELCGRIPSLEGDENLIPINKKKGR
jgi:hypothetical protein